MTITILNGSAQPAAGNVVISKAAPVSPAQKTLWIAQRNDESIKPLEDWKVVAPDFTPGVPLSALYGWYGAQYINDKSDGDPIPQWNDLSGNARHLTQSVVSKRPAYVALGQNGLPVVRFTEAAATMLQALSLSLAQPFEVFMVFKVRTDANALKTNLIQVGGSTGLRWSAAAGGGARGLEFELTGFWVGSSTTAPLSWNSYRLVVDSANAGTRAYRTSADTSMGAGVNNGTAALIQLTIGSTSGTATDIDWGELILTNRLLTVGERAALGSYLTGQWGTA